MTGFSEIETIIGAMSLEEKTGLISGKDWFYTKPIPSQFHYKTLREAI
jgi:hypothetical protein